ncbi:MAG: efflux RND transporter permease subunit, partial [Acidobacteria bacterium]|nr:efflux RND transporter permease subunit [Acidobacteriota bacterium]
MVVASAVPVSLFVALFAMRLWDHSLNIITLAGLALGAGMLVDNAIVVVESIHRRHRPGASAADSSARGTGEVAGAIAASTLTTCVVFLPVLFVQGLAARLIEGIAFTVTASLAASLAVAMMLIPALSRWFLPRAKPAAGVTEAAGAADDALAAESDDAEARPLGWAFGALERFVLFLLRLRWLVVGAAVLAAAAAVNVLLGLGSELLPPADPRQFSVRMVGPPGQRVEATAAAIATLEQAVRQAAGEHLEAIQAEVGRLPEDDRLVTTELTEENTARLLVRLSAEGPTGGQIVAALSPNFTEIPDTEIEWEVGTSALAEALGSSGPPIVVEIAGQSLPDLRSAS